MSNYLAIITVVNIVSLIGLYLILRKIAEMVRRQIHILGPDARFLVIVNSTKVFRYIYISLIITLAATSYILIR